MNNLATNKLGLEPYRVLSIELEPTHYKADLWNKISCSKKVDVEVLFTQSKNWEPDGGHNYLHFPKQHFPNVVLSGQGFFGSLMSTLYVIKTIVLGKPDIVVVCGYSHAQTAFAQFASIVFRKPFLVYVDQFNLKKPIGNFQLFKWFFREMLRKCAFVFSKGVLVCGRNGFGSAIAAGCVPDKLYNFPYVIDLERILTDSPNVIPKRCIEDALMDTPIIFFSGRMIERKGLPSLIKALSSISENIEWVLWIEGDGPELDHYTSLASQYGISHRCRFLGFCQYDLHSWLIRNSNIVIVPSLEDNWGIVVDEGLQLGKIVVSSDAAGSACDRITDKVNGFIFKAGDSESLADIIMQLLTQSFDTVANAAKHCSKNVTPEDNLETLLSVIRNIVK